MAVNNRGGPPFFRQLTVTTGGVISIAGVSGSAQAAGTPIQLPAATSHLRLKATTNDVRWYTNQKDYDADTNYMTLPAGTVVELWAEVDRMWLKAQTGSATVEVAGISKV